MGIFDRPHLTQSPRGLGTMIRNVITDTKDYNEDTGTGNYRRDEKAEPRTDLTSVIRGRGT